MIAEPSVSDSILMEGKSEFPSHNRNVTQVCKLQAQSSLRMREREAGTYCTDLYWSKSYHPPVTPSTDEMPYFQCFFVDEDEAQFPFYAFSPLQIWSFSLNPAWGLQFSQFTDNDKVTSRPTLLKRSPLFTVGLQEKNPGQQRMMGDFMWWTDFILFPDLVELSYQIHAASVIPFYFFIFFYF